MSRIYLERNPLLILLGITLAMFLYTIWNYEIGLDDAWFAEQAYWFAQKGYVISELLSGLNNFDERHLTYHRLHIWQGAFAYQLFGWSIFTFKSISLVYLFLFLACSYLYIKKFKILELKVEYLIFYILILSHALTVKMSFNYRPEIPMMALGFLSFYLLHSSIAEQNIFKIIMSGIVAGLCVIFHLNGVVFLFAAGIVLLVTKNYRLLVMFSVASILTSLVYFIEISNKQLLDLYILQFTNNPALSSKDFSLTGSIMKFLSFHRMYFHKGSDAIYTLLLIYVFWSQRSIILQNENLKVIFVYFISIVICLALISPGGKSIYLIYHAPYALLLVAALFKSICEQNIVRKRTITTMVSIFLLVQWVESYSLLPKEDYDLPTAHKELAKELAIPKGEKIVAPMVFVFNEMQDYNIQSFQPYRIRALKKFIQIEEFFSLASKDGRKFLILNDYDMHDLKLGKITTGSRQGNYIYNGRRGLYYIFTHI